MGHAWELASPNHCHIRCALSGSGFYIADPSHTATWTVVSHDHAGRTSQASDRETDTHLFHGNHVGRGIGAVDNHRAVEGARP